MTRGRPQPGLRQLAAPILRAPFSAGLQAAAGALLAYAVLQAVAAIREVLTLVLVAGFLAVGVNPAVSYLRRRGLPRPAAVTVVLLGLFVVVAGALATFVPPLVGEVQTLAKTAPGLIGHLRTVKIVDALDEHFDVVAKGQRYASDTLGKHPERLVGGLLGLGRAVLGLLASVVAVLALTAYFVIEGPTITRYLHRLVPRSRRARVALLTDEIAARVGGYVLGKLITAVLFGGFMFVLLFLLHVPFAAALALLAALVSAIPLIGGWAAAVVVAPVALTVSVRVTVLAIALMTAYRLVEDYVITPRIMRRSVDISPVLTIVSVFFGGALLGLVGALVAIPAAAAVQLITREVVGPRVDAA